MGQGSLLGKSQEAPEAATSSGASQRHPGRTGQPAFSHCLPNLGFPCGSAGKESTCNVGDLGSIPRLGRSPGAGKGSPLLCSGLENSVDSIVHGVAESWTRLSNLQFQPFLVCCSVTPVSLSIISLRFAHVRTWDRISFFFKEG